MAVSCLIVAAALHLLSQETRAQNDDMARRLWISGPRPRLDCHVVGVTVSNKRLTTSPFLEANQATLLCPAESPLFCSSLQPMELRRRFAERKKNEASHLSLGNFPVPVATGALRIRPDARPHQGPRSLPHALVIDPSV
jgi:hypothetical protein